jgi:hypothetical protein
MARVMVALIGEQPVPNLLPARHLRPDAALLVHTELTRTTASHVKKALEPTVTSELFEVDPYDMASIQLRLMERLVDLSRDDHVVLNLTGGTKPMAMASLEVARRLNSPFVYFQSEANESRLSYYRIDRDSITLAKVEDVPETLTIDDYLRLHLGAYERDAPRNDFEREVALALAADPRIAEVMTSLRPQGLGALEVDFVVRRGNQVGIGEVKTQAAKAGIDQINAVSDPRYLGTYVHKFLVSGKMVDSNNKELAEAYRIEVIELPSFGEAGTLSPRDKEQLVTTVAQKLSR